MLLFLLACGRQPGFDDGAPPSTDDSAPLPPDDSAGDSGDSAGPGDTTPDDSGADTADTDTGPAAPPADPELVESWTTSRWRWGIDVGNNLKKYPAVWDPGTQHVLVAGVQLPTVLRVDPTVGHPDSSFTLPTVGHHPPELALDPGRRVLYVVSRGNGSAVALDADTGTVLGRNPMSYTQADSPDDMRVPQVAVDPTSGQLWVVDAYQGTLLAYPPGLDGPPHAWTGLGHPGGVAVDPHGDRVYAYDADDGTIHVIVPSTGSDTVFAQLEPSSLALLAVAADGTVVAEQTVVSAFSPDGTALWSVPLHGSPGALAVAGTRAAVVRLHAAEGYGLESNRAVTLLDLADGATTTVEVGWGADTLGGDDDEGRFFVGDGSDGTVTVVDSASAAVTQTLMVASSPTVTVDDPVGGLRYTLDRSAGFVAEAWNSSGLDGLLDAGPWPLDLALDHTRRRLVIADHLAAQLVQWDLDAGKALPPLRLHVPSPTSETQGDFDYDEASGLAAVVYPETGYVALADLGTGEERWHVQVDGLAVGLDAGAGHAWVQVDPAHDRVWLFDDTPGELLGLDLATGTTMETLTLPEGEHYPYQLRGMFLDPADARLYLGDLALSLPDLETVGTLTDPVRVLCRVDGWLYAVEALTDSSEEVVRLDPTTLAATPVAALGTTSGMRMETSCDPDQRELFVADGEAAAVRRYVLP